MREAGLSSYRHLLEDKEEIVRIAVRALGDMRSGGGSAATGTGNSTAQRHPSSSFGYTYDDRHRCGSASCPVHRLD